jgi:hypothetical protein
LFFDKIFNEILSKNILLDGILVKVRQAASGTALLLGNGQILAKGTGSDAVSTFTAGTYTVGTGDSASLLTGAGAITVGTAPLTLSNQAAITTTVASLGTNLAELADIAGPVTITDDAVALGAVLTLTNNAEVTFNGAFADHASYALTTGTGKVTFTGAATFNNAALTLGGDAVFSGGATLKTGVVVDSLITTGGTGDFVIPAGSAWTSNVLELSDDVALAASGTLAIAAGGVIEIAADKSIATGATSSTITFGSGGVVIGGTGHAITVTAQDEAATLTATSANAGLTIATDGVLDLVGDAGTTTALLTIPASKAIAASAGAIKLNSTTAASGGSVTLSKATLSSGSAGLATVNVATTAATVNLATGSTGAGLVLADGGSITLAGTGIVSMDQTSNKSITLKKQAAGQAAAVFTATSSTGTGAADVAFASTANGGTITIGTGSTTAGIFQVSATGEIVFGESASTDGIVLAAGQTNKGTLRLLSGATLTGFTTTAPITAGAGSLSSPASDSNTDFAADTGDTKLTAAAYDTNKGVDIGPNNTTTDVPIVVGTDTES